jgi:secreted trypsin-like serine protease
VHKVSIVGLAAAVVTGVVFAASTLMSDSGSAGAVAKGADAGQGQFPYSVKLTMTGIPRTDGTTYDSSCSAGLVNPRYIVTAGHCFHDAARNPVSGPPPYKSTKATIGVVDLTTGGGTTVDVVDVRQSPSNDIAVAKLSRPVTAAKYLHIGQAKPTAGQQLVIAGWGDTDSNGTASPKLQWGKFQVSAVQPTELNVHGVWPEADTSACPHDSGAPYFSLPETGDATLVAVEHDGPDCPHTTDETTERVDVVADWINSQIAK